jgi:hypothetical protein
LGLFSFVCDEFCCGGCGFNREQVSIRNVTKIKMEFALSLNVVDEKISGRIFVCKKGILAPGKLHGMS